MRKFRSAMRASSALGVLVALGASASQAWAQGAEFDAQPGLGLINADVAYAEGWTGTGVVVAIIDSGLFTLHPEFLAATIPGYNAATGSDGAAEGDGHGTHVAGIIGARRDGIGMHGVAPSAILFPIKLVDIDENTLMQMTQHERDRMFSVNIARALDAAIDRNAFIVNGSIGLNVEDPPPGVEPRTMIDLTPKQFEEIYPEFLAAARRIAADERIVVFTTGNESEPNADILAGLPHLFPELAGTWLAVGAATLEGERTDYSSSCGLAASWCLWAPGGGEGVEGIYSTGHLGGYLHMAGTSMAAPHVSGALAVLKEKFLDLGSRDLVQLLLLTAEDMGDPGVDPIFGHGGLNLGRAIGGPTIPGGESLTVDSGPTGSIAYTLALGGAGGLVKNGAGTVTLAGRNTYTGPTTINGGKLAVTGSLESIVTVGSGGTLSGTGSVGGIALGSGGMLAPGASIGTLKVNGDLALSEQGATEIEVDAAGRSDRLDVTGDVALAGSLRVLALDPEAAFAPRSEYVFLSHGGARTGTFARIDHAFALLTPSLAYNSPDVTLTLRRAPLASVAAEPNQVAVARALDGIVDAGTLASSPFKTFLGEIYATSGPDGRRRVTEALDSVSGDAHATNATATNLAIAGLTRTLLDRTRTLRFGSGPSVGPQAAYASLGSAATAVRQPSSIVWGQAFGALGSSDATGDGPRAAFNRRGFVFGLDGALTEDVYLGLAGGYSNQTVETAARGGRTGIDSLHAALYGGASLGDLRLSGTLGYARQSAETRRSVLFAGTAKSDYKANLFHGVLEASGIFKQGAAVIEPFGRLGFLHYSEGAFRETGAGALGLASGGQTTTRFNATAGIGLATTVSLPQGGSLTPYLRAAWQRDFGDVGARRTFSFVGGGGPFTIRGGGGDRDSALLDAGLRLDLVGDVSLELGYAGAFARSSREHSLNAGFSMRF